MFCNNVVMSLNRMSKVFLWYIISELVKTIRFKKKMVKFFGSFFSTRVKAFFFFFSVGGGGGGAVS